MYARAGAGPPLIVTLSKNVARLGDRLLLRDADAPDGAPGADDCSAVTIDCLADALEHRVGAEAAGQLAHALDRLVAALADDVGRAELARERDAVGMAAEDDDLLGAEPPRGDHAAEPDGAVADDGRRLAGPDAGARAPHGGRSTSRR